MSYKELTIEELSGPPAGSDNDHYDSEDEDLSLLSEVLFDKKKPSFVSPKPKVGDLKSSMEQLLVILTSSKHQRLPFLSRLILMIVIKFPKHLPLQS